MVTQLYEKILVAIDGSDRNKTAIEEALRIARGTGSMVYAVFVKDIHRYNSTPTDVIMVDLQVTIQKLAEDALAVVRDLSEGVNLETVVLEGKPDVEIVRFAEEKGIDLIVIGTNAKRGFERLLLGSVAEQVIRTTSCKILVVK
ncbi:universal stress protein [Methanospirillum lacunae]|uniref:Universal stress protein n=1 Tax=Methanospirillum lacunae TaxID=668570 RepID=A0A2V2N808_9EURY|nr:universal stress protein [Methanospirillum lacunae]PWR71413.1 universal stress protein [Methanospirillum lacunae]